MLPGSAMPKACSSSRRRRRISDDQDRDQQAAGPGPPQDGGARGRRSQQPQRGPGQQHGQQADHGAGDEPTAGSAEAGQRNSRLRRRRRRPSRLGGRARASGSSAVRLARTARRPAAAAVGVGGRARPRRAVRCGRRPGGRPARARESARARSGSRRGLGGLGASARAARLAPARRGGRLGSAASRAPCRLRPKPSDGSSREGPSSSGPCQPWRRSVPDRTPDSGTSGRSRSARATDERSRQIARGRTQGFDLRDTMVGLTGFEPAASSSRTRRATKLRHSPIARVDRSRPRARRAYPSADGPSKSGSTAAGQAARDERQQGRLGAAGDAGSGRTARCPSAGRDVQPGRARVAGRGVGRVPVQALGPGGLEVAVGGQRADARAGRPGRRGCGRRGSRRSRRRRTGRAPGGTARARRRAARRRRRRPARRPRRGRRSPGAGRRRRRRRSVVLADLERAAPVGQVEPAGVGEAARRSRHGQLRACRCARLPSSGSR